MEWKRRPAQYRGRGRSQVMAKEAMQLGACDAANKMGEVSVV